MKLTRDNLHATVTEATADERQWLILALRYNDRQGRYRGRETVPVFDTVNDRFPAGLLPLVGEKAGEDGVAIQLDDTRDPPLVQHPVDLSWLDDQQREALRAMLHFGRGVVDYGTGGGKTELYIAVALTYRDDRVLFVAPRTQLVTQARDRWCQRTGQAAGLIAEKTLTLDRVTFATFTALHRAQESAKVRTLLRETRVLLADEAHTGAANTFYPLLMATPNARVRLGGSATPLDRTDDRAVYTLGALGPVIHTVKARDLGRARIVPPTVHLLPVKQYATRAHPRDLAPNRACTGCGAIADEPCAGDCNHIIGGGGYYRRVYTELVVQSTLRNTTFVDALLKLERPFLVFVKELDHARALHVLLKRHAAVEVVSGVKSSHQRTTIASHLRRGELDGAIATSVWEAGVDIPNLRTVGNAGAGASDIRTIQILGRVLRAAEGKDACTMLDVLDVGEPVLARHAQRRRRAYQDQGWKVTLAAQVTAT